MSDLLVAALPVVALPVAQVRDGRVAAICLPSNNLLGQLPRNFGASGLGFLQKLDLSDNQLGVRNARSPAMRSVPA